MSPFAALLLVVGLVALVAGGELLVRGATGLARSLNVPPLLVGLTVVSLATSAPELTVTLQATLSGTPDLAVGNVVGSNIANVLLVLGAAAMVAPLVVTWGVVRRDVPVMIGFTAGLLLLTRDGTLGRPQGALLLVATVVYLVIAVHQARRSQDRTAGLEALPPTPAPPGADATNGVAPEQITDGSGTGAAHRPAEGPSLLVCLLLVSTGVGLLVLGANALVEGATSIAASLGISDLVIGLTVVAVGTSLPELAASIVAVLRGERDLAVGNIVGSNIANIGLVLGLTSLVSDDGLPVPAAAVAFDIPVLMAVSFALLPVAFTGMAISRWEGGVFLAYYTAYSGYVLLDANDHDVLPRYSAVMGWFVIPVTALTILVMVAYEVGLLRRVDPTTQSAPPQPGGPGSR